MNHPSSAMNFLTSRPPDDASSIRFLPVDLRRPITIPSFATMTCGEMFCKWDGDKKTTTYVSKASFHSILSRSFQSGLTNIAAESWRNVSLEDSIIDVPFKGHEVLNVEFCVRRVSVDDMIEPVIFEKQALLITPVNIPDCDFKKWIY